MTRLPGGGGTVRQEQAAETTPGASMGPTSWAYGGTLGGHYPRQNAANTPLYFLILQTLWRHLTLPWGLIWYRLLAWMLWWLSVLGEQPSLPSRLSRHRWTSSCALGSVVMGTDCWVLPAVHVPTRRDYRIACLACSGKTGSL